MLLTTKQIKQQLHINQQTRKTFVFDLDGTIVYQGLPLEAKFEKVLREITSAGHELIFATGRSWRDFTPVMPNWCTAQPLVLFGGGLVLTNEEIIHQKFMPNLSVVRSLERLEQKQIAYLVDGHRSYYHPPLEHWLYDDIIKISGQPREHTVDNIVSDGAYKIMVLHDQWLGEFQGFIEQEELDLVIKHHSYDKCFDLMPARVNKLTGLSELQLPDLHDVFVFGNDHNDLELMEKFPNSIMFGHNPQLQRHAKLQIAYDDDLFTNFAQIITTILK